MDGHRCFEYCVHLTIALSFNELQAKCILQLPGAQTHTHIYIYASMIRVHISVHVCVQFPRGKNLNHTPRVNT